MVRKDIRYKERPVPEKSNDTYVYRYKMTVGKEEAWQVSYHRYLEIA